VTDAGTLVLGFPRWRTSFLGWRDEARPRQRAENARSTSGSRAPLGNQRRSKQPPAVYDLVNVTMATGGGARCERPARPRSSRLFFPARRRGRGAGPVACGRRLPASLDIPRPPRAARSRRSFCRGRNASCPTSSTTFVRRLQVHARGWQTLDASVRFSPRMEAQGRADPSTASASSRTGSRCGPRSIFRYVRPMGTKLDDARRGSRCGGAIAGCLPTPEHDLLFSATASPEAAGRGSPPAGSRRSGLTRKPGQVELAEAGGVDAARNRRTPGVVARPRRRLVDTPVYDGHLLAAGATIAGPADRRSSRARRSSCLDGFDLGGRPISARSFLHTGERGTRAGSGF